MPERLRQRWDDLLHQVRAHEVDADPAAALEAFGYALVYGLLEAEGSLPDADRRLLLSLEPTIKTRARELSLASADADERDEWLQAVAVAEAGASALGVQRAPSIAGLLSDPIEPSPRRLLSMLKGELDGFSAASVAAWYLRRDPEEVRRLWRLRDGAADEVEPILLAADGHKSVRSPMGGRLLGELAALHIEAIFFDEDRQLAVYSADRLPVRVMAESFTTLDTQLGYWLGTVEPGVKGSVEVEVRVGEKVERWTLEI